MENFWQQLSTHPALRELSTALQKSPEVIVAGSAAELAALATRDADASGWHEVAYETPLGRAVEAKVCRVKNGISANYPDPYMRRRDPDCLLIGDELPTDKPSYRSRTGKPFSQLRSETYTWLGTQPLVVVPFRVGLGRKHALAVIPLNAAFFAFGLALLQGIEPWETLAPDFNPSALILVAPPFRHSHFDGRQAVVHHRGVIHELFSYNLYPGPSAKKGVYGVLLHLGEAEGWLTAHCSAVQVSTPYDLTVTFMHEGASGGGKSEMLEHIHREKDGRLHLGTNLVTGESVHVTLGQNCNLRPVTDDMALCHPAIQTVPQKLCVKDAERGWFIRVDHIRRYGTDPDIEALTINAEEPLLFLNIDAHPSSTALIWEHTQDAPGVSCPNPRVIIPRHLVPDVWDKPVAVDIRSFGVRAAPCTREQPSYGIFGIFHLLSPELAWLWRLAAPRGHANPSVIDSTGLKSEGVGSYWPFATGRRVDQANLLLEQILRHADTAFILCPNQHIGAWKVGFSPQWLAREYLARRGSAHFEPEKLRRARCPLLGHTPRSMTIEGQLIDPIFLHPEKQPEVGTEAYDKGAELLQAFFTKELTKYLTAELHPRGRQIVECLLETGSLDTLPPY